MFYLWLVGCFASVEKLLLHVFSFATDPCFPPMLLTPLIATPNTHLLLYLYLHTNTNTNKNTDPWFPIVANSTDCHSHIFLLTITLDAFLGKVVRSPAFFKLDFHIPIYYLELSDLTCCVKRLEVI